MKTKMSATWGQSPEARCVDVPEHRNKADATAGHYPT